MPLICKGTCRRETAEAISRLCGPSGHGLGLLANLSVRKVDLKRPLNPGLTEGEAKTSGWGRSSELTTAPANEKRVVPLRVAR